MINNNEALTSVNRIDSKHKEEMKDDDTPQSVLSKKEPQISITSQQLRNDLQKEHSINIILLNAKPKVKAEGVSIDTHKPTKEETLQYPDEVCINRCEELRRTLAQLKGEYGELLHEEQSLKEMKQLNSQIAELNAEYDKSLQAKHRLSKSLNDIHQQVQTHWTRIGQTPTIFSKLLKRQIIQRSASDITLIATLQEKEQSNLKEMSVILKRDIEKCQFLLSHYSNPNEVETKETMLASINLSIEALDSELLSLRRCYEAHLRCSTDEEKLRNDLLLLRQEHCTFRQRDINEQVVGGTSRGMPMNLKYKLLGTEKRKEELFDEYSKVFQSKENSAHKGKRSTELQKFNLFRNDELHALKEVIPINYLNKLTTKYKVIEDSSRVMSKHASQELNYFKHTIDTANVAYLESKSQISLEKKKAAVLLNDFKREMVNISNIKQRILELSKTLGLAQREIQMKENENKEMRETIALLSFDIKPEVISKKKYCPKCDIMFSENSDG